MKKLEIAFSICGEGHGHYGRTIEIIKTLSRKLPNCNITLYSYGDVLEIYKLDKNIPKNVRIKEIPGFRFKYRPEGFLKSILTTAFDLTNNIVFFKTISLTLLYIITFPVTKIFSLIFKKDIFKNYYSKYFDYFDFAITDLEPLLPRVALLRNKPFLTFDNQHAMLYGDIEIHKFEFTERIEHLFISTFLRTYHPRSDFSILTTFTEIPIKKQYRKKVVAIGPLIRKEIVELKGKEKYENYILVYAHKILRKNLFPILLNLKEENFIIFTKFDDELKNYSLNEKHITLFQIDPVNFAQKLLNCKAIISSAGNTTLGEALFLKKPFFAISLEGQFEQRLNRYLLEKKGWGTGCKLSELKKEHLVNFIKNIEIYKNNLKDANIEDHTEKITSIMLNKIKKELKLTES